MTDYHNFNQYCIIWCKKMNYSLRDQRMRRILAVLIIFSAVMVAYAQKAGRASRQYGNVRVKAMVLDAKSSKPIPNVTVYLIPQGDTTITDFALSGENGLAVLDKVVPGKYELNAEQLGYKAFSKVYDLPDIVCHR